MFPDAYYAYPVA